MKKFFSIILACLILFMGMHISFATHICGGEISSMILSFKGENATCGMEKSTTNCPNHNTITSNCCKNNIVSYTIDNNYNSTTSDFKEILKNIFPIFLYRSNTSLYSLDILQNSKTNESPPLNLLLSNVSLSVICIYRI